MNGAELVARPPQFDERRMRGGRGGQPRLTERRAQKATARNANWRPLAGGKKCAILCVSRPKSRDPERKKRRKTAGNDYQSVNRGNS
jgi:hypothetical protein